MFLQSLAIALCALLTFWSPHINAQFHHDFEHARNDQLTWCTLNAEEQMKCQNFSKAIELDRAFFDDVYYNLTCHQAFTTEECIQLIDLEKAHLMSLDAGEVFVAGRYNSLIPILQEGYEGGFTNYYAVAVLKKDTLSDVRSLHDLRNKKACFAYVGSQAGWTIPIFTLQREGGMAITDCNNHVKTATAYFGPSCAVNSLINKYNPIGDNSDKLCSLCTGTVPGGKCTQSDPYAGFEGAFRCLMEAGDIAFLTHTTVEEMVVSKSFKGVEIDQFQILCKNGQRMALSEYRQCNWGRVPSHAVVTSSARLADERRQYQRFLQKAIERYSRKPIGTYTNGTYQDNNGQQQNKNRNDDSRYYNPNERFNPTTDRYNNNNNRYDSGRNYEERNDNRNNYFEQNNTMDENGKPYEKFEVFESARYGRRLNLMFQDAARTLVPIKEENQNFAHYLGDALEIILDVRHCPVGRMTLCVTSDPEMDKCVKMRTALKAQLIKPEMQCYKAHSHINCMQAIRSGLADVSVLDASDVYTAGLRYDLIPFISEIYNAGEPEYYVVAVAKESDPDTELTFLKGKYTCHTGMNTAAGWVYPMAYLISNGWIRPYGCDSVRAAAEYFTKSCIPGALSTEYNTGVPYDNMCDLCHGPSYRYCRRDASEDYYGHTGAFRCLVEGGGDVAFVKHTTVSENTGGKRREWWARDTLDDDFELLCPDGTRARMTEFERCNLGRVKANAVVTRGGEGYNQTQLDSYINLFIYAQQYYGRKERDDFSFSMFFSPPPYHDLIFQDATRQLRVVHPSKRNYAAYVGKDFLRARRITDCDAGANSVKTNSFLLTVFVGLMVCLQSMF